MFHWFLFLFNIFYNVNIYLNNLYIQIIKAIKQKVNFPYYLKGLNGRIKVTRPLIILLDLNMPLMNGLEFLEVVKNDPELKYIPVIILTSSANDEDITRAYEKQVAGYLTKPVGLEQFIEKMATMGKYWTLCEL